MFKAFIRYPCIAHRGSRSCLGLRVPAAHAAPGETAQTGSCLEDTATVRACSDKELSNVVVQCSSESGSYFVKYDDLDDGTYAGLTSPY